MLIEELSQNQNYIFTYQLIFKHIYFFIDLSTVIIKKERNPSKLKEKKLIKIKHCFKHFISIWQNYLSTLGKTTNKG